MVQKKKKTTAKKTTVKKVENPAPANEIAAVQPKLGPKPTVKFHKGLALLWATAWTVLAVVVIGFTAPALGIKAIWLYLLAGVFAFICAKKMGIKSDKGVTWAPWVYIIVVTILGEYGLLVFFYDVKKFLAKGKGADVNVKKDFLFYLLVLLWMIPLLLAMYIGYQMGYESAMAR